MTEILIVEDDSALNEGIVLGLGKTSYSFTQCYTLCEAQEAVKEKDFSLIILDINLPDGSGYEFLKEYRRKNSNPVLMLTANDLEMNEVMGFELGANDYVTKPFSLAVLRVRIENLLRLVTMDNGKGRYEDEHILLDPTRLVYEKDGKPIALSRTEQKLLQILLENRGNTVPRDRLIDKVWTDGMEYVDENALPVAISRLRAKLEVEPSKPEHILNVYGIGYVWKK